MGNKKIIIGVIALVVIIVIVAAVLTRNKKPASQTSQSNQTQTAGSALPSTNFNPPYPQLNHPAITWQTYSSSNLKFQVDYPNGWNKTENGSSVSLSYAQQGSDKNAIGGTFTVNYDNSAATAYTKAQLQQRFGSSSVIAATIGGLQGYVAAPGGAASLQRQYFLPRSSGGWYIITTIADQANVTDSQNALDHMLSTVKFN